MIELAREVLAGIRTVDQMVAAFQDEERCRQLLEAMVWPRGRLCPKCGYKNSIALAGRDVGRRARPGLYQCSSGGCRFQFTVTTRTPLHSTKGLYAQTLENSVKLDFRLPQSGAALAC
jgi:transposase-like protein